MLNGWEIGGGSVRIHRADVQAKARARARVPTEAVEIDGVALHGIDADKEGEVLILVDAGGGRVAFDLLSGTFDAILIHGSFSNG